MTNYTTVTAEGNVIVINTYCVQSTSQIDYYLSKNKKTPYNAIFVGLPTGHSHASIMLEPEFAIGNVYEKNGVKISILAHKWSENWTGGNCSFLFGGLNGNLILPWSNGMMNRSSAEAYLSDGWKYIGKMEIKVKA